MNAIRNLWGPALTLGAAGALLLASTSESDAARTRFFRTEGYDAFKKLELDSVELSEDGRVLPGLAATPLGDPVARNIWRMASARGRILASSGDEGKLFRIEDDVPEPFAGLYDYELFALTADAEGNVYAAGAPSGSIVRVAPNGETETLFTPPEGLIFDLVVGGDGSLFVAAGERGKIYRVRPDGKTDVLAETGDVHARTLAWSRDGKKLWVGTNGRGLVQEVDPGSGAVRIAYDAEEDEVVRILPLEDGGILFATNPSFLRSEPAEGSPGPSPKPTLYHLSSAGSVRALWSTTEKTIHDLVAQEDGSVLVATGGAGALYRVDRDGRETVLWRAEEDQIVCLLRAGDEMYAGTGNPGRIYRIGPQRAESASLTSEVLDARDQALWGKLSWETEGPGSGVRFETRTGFTSLPDETWSPWKTVGDEPRGSQIGSPPGRYIQWRAELGGGSGSVPVLRSVRLPYLPSNRKPTLDRLTLSSQDQGFRSERGGASVSQTLPGGVQIDYSMGGGGRANTLPPEGVPTWVQQLRSIVWEGNDPDGDDLVYRLEIRQVGESDYRLVADELTDPAYTLETGLLPNGSYEVRITASDAPSNSPGEGLSAVRTSGPFQVDNTPPSVLDLSARKDRDVLAVAGRAVDEDSPLRALQVSVDGGPFQGVPALDGLIDSADESFRVELPLESPERGNWVVVQARDSAGNVGTFRAWLEP